MADGKVVLPLAFYQVQTGQPAEHSDSGEIAGVLPAAASRWAVHWAANPALEVYTAVFNLQSEHFFSPSYHEHIQSYARRIFASSFSTGPPRD